MLTVIIRLITGADAIRVFKLVANQILESNFLGNE